MCYVKKNPLTGNHDSLVLTLRTLSIFPCPIISTIPSNLCASNVGTLNFSHVSAPDFNIVLPDYRSYLCYDLEGWGFSPQSPLPGSAPAPLYFVEKSNMFLLMVTQETNSCGGSSHPHILPNKVMAKLACS